MKFGELLKKARKAAGLTQAALGEKIGVKGVSIMRYEKGQRKPRVDQLNALARALNISPGDLATSTPDNAREALKEWLKALTIDQAERLVDHMDILKLLSRMTEKELIFTETFLTKIFGGCAV